MRILTDYSKTDVQLEVKFVALFPLDILARDYQCHRSCYRNVASVYETSFEKNEDDNLRWTDHITEEGNLFK